MDLDDPFGFGEPMFFDKQGCAISLLALAELSRDPGYGTIGRTRVAAYEVCTDWVLGRLPPLEHEPPLIFETMVSYEYSEWDGLLRTRGSTWTGWAWRYATEKDAAAGHWLISVLTLADVLFRLGLPPGAGA